MREKHEAERHAHVENVKQDLGNQHKAKVEAVKQKMERVAVHK